MRHWIAFGSVLLLVTVACDAFCQHSTPGTISGEVAVQSLTSASDSLTVAESRGILHLANYAGETTYNLPAVSGCTGSDGCNLCVYALQAQKVNVNPDDNDRIVLDGTALSDGEAIYSNSASGDYVCLVGDSSSGWITMGRAGTWTQETP